MGVMSPYHKARKEHRKLPFLKAFGRIGTISGAARACRISRDAVHDWINNDESFAREMSHAKRRFQDEAFMDVYAALVFMTSVIRPVIPKDVWPRVAATLAIAVANLKNDLKGGRRNASNLTGQVAESSLPRMRIEDVAIPIRGRDCSADDL